LENEFASFGLLLLTSAPTDPCLIFSLYHNQTLAPWVTPWSLTVNVFWPPTRPITPLSS